MPVAPSFATTHQWVRELRASHDERMVAVHLTLPRDEPVYVGRFSQPHELRPLGDAIGWVREHPAGAELVIPRSASVREVVRVRDITQRVGWVETPESTSHYDCVCVACIPRGRRDLQRRVRAALARCRVQIRDARDEASLVDAIGRMDTPLERARGRVSPRSILRFAQSESETVRRSVAWVLGWYRAADVAPTLLALAGDASPRVRETAIEAFVRVVGIRRAGAAFLEMAPETLASFVEQLDCAADVGVAAGLLRRALVRPEGEVRAAARRTALALLEDDEVPRDVRRELTTIAASSAGSDGDS
jgi:hypothetical protein